MTFLDKFLAKQGKYSPGGMFSFGHFLLLITTVICVVAALKRSAHFSVEKVRQIIRSMCIILWVLEICKIIFKFTVDKTGNQPGTWVPLYYCSIALFALILSGYAKGYARHIGDVFLATGSIVGGLCFLVYPSSSLLLYPWQHFMCIHSFLYHGCMVYIGAMMNRLHVIDLSYNDFAVYALYVGFFCILALLVNMHTGSNLMFISKPFTGTFLEGFYHVLYRAYTPVLILAQMSLPFIAIMFLLKHLPQL